MPDLEAIGQKLKDAREAAGLTQAEAAQRLGMHPMTVSRWERGEQEMKTDAAKRVAELYRVPLADLLDVDSGEVSADDEQVRLGKPAYSARPRAAYVPVRAYEAVLSYLRRLDAARIPDERIDRYERILLDDRWAIRRRGQSGEAPTEEEWIDRVEEIWQIIREALAQNGVVP